MPKYKIKIVDPTDATKYSEELDSDIWPQKGDHYKSGWVLHVKDGGETDEVVVRVSLTKP